MCAAWRAPSTRACATSGRSSSSTRSTRAWPATSAIRLIQRLLRDASKRGGIRFHVACADDGDNVELFMQAGFMRYGEEILLYRPPDQPPVATSPRAEARDSGHPARPCRSTRSPSTGCIAASTPAPVARLEDYRQHDWERQGNHWRMPRSSLTPILRFADVEAFVQEATGGKADGELAGLLPDRRRRRRTSRTTFASSRGQTTTRAT